MLETGWIQLNFEAQGLGAEYTAILLLDSDMTATGDLTHLFILPTDFAAMQR